MHDVLDKRRDCVSVVYHRGSQCTEWKPLVIYQTLCSEINEQNLGFVHRSILYFSPFQMTLCFNSNSVYYHFLLQFGCLSEKDVDSEHNVSIKSMLFESKIKTILFRIKNNCWFSSKNLTRFPVANPGFFRGGDFAKFALKNCMKLKEFGPGGGASD